jgi:hypothetical protein
MFAYRPSRRVGPRLLHNGTRPRDGDPPVGPSTHAGPRDGTGTAVGASANPNAGNTPPLTSGPNGVSPTTPRFATALECVRECATIIRRHISTEPLVTRVVTKWVLLPPIVEPAPGQVGPVLAAVRRVCDPVLGALVHNWDIGMATGYVDICHVGGLDTAIRRDGHPCISLDGFQPADREALADMLAWPGTDIWVNPPALGGAVRVGLTPWAMDELFPVLERGPLLWTFVRCILERLTTVSEEPFLQAVTCICDGIETVVARLDTKNLPAVCVRAVADAKCLIARLRTWPTWLTRAVGDATMCPAATRRLVLSTFVGWRGMDAGSATAFLWATACLPIHLPSKSTRRRDAAPTLPTEDTGTNADRRLATVTLDDIFNGNPEVFEGTRTVSHALSTQSIAAYIARIEVEHTRESIRRFGSTPGLLGVVALQQFMYPPSERDDAMAQLMAAFHDKERPTMATATVVGSSQHRRHDLATRDLCGDIIMPEDLPRDAEALFRAIATALAEQGHPRREEAFAPMCAVSTDTRSAKVYSAQAATRALLLASGIGAATAQVLPRAVVATAVAGPGQHHRPDLAPRHPKRHCASPEPTPPPFRQCETVNDDERELVALFPYQLPSALMLANVVPTSVFTAVTFPYLNAALFTMYSDAVARRLVANAHLPASCQPSAVTLEFNWRVRALCTTYAAAVPLVIDRVAVVGAALRPQHCVRCVGTLLTAWRTGAAPIGSSVAHRTGMLAYLAAITMWDVDHGQLVLLVDAITFLATAVFTLMREDAGGGSYPAPHTLPTVSEAVVPRIVQELWHAFRLAGIVLAAFQTRGAVTNVFSHAAWDTLTNTHRAPTGDTTLARILTASLMCDAAPAMCDSDWSGLAAATVLVSTDQMMAGACSGAGLDGVLVASCRRVFTDAWLPVRGAELVMQTSCCVNTTWVSNALLGVGLVALAIQADTTGSLAVVHDLQVPLFPIVAHHAAIGMAWIPHETGVLAVPDECIIRACVWLRVAVGEAVHRALAPLHTVGVRLFAEQCRVGIRTLLTLCHKAGGWQTLWRLTTQRVYGPHWIAPTTTEQWCAVGTLTPTLLAVLRAEPEAVASVTALAPFLPTARHAAAVLKCVAAASRGVCAQGWPRQRRPGARRLCPPVVTEDTQDTATTSPPAGTDPGTAMVPPQAETLLHILATMNLFKYAKARPLSQADMAGHGVTTAQRVCQWHPELPSIASTVWPVNNDAVWRGAYALAASAECVQAGCSSREWTMVARTPFLEPENTTPIRGIAMHAPFTAPTPDLLNTILGSLSLFGSSVQGDGTTHTAPV